MSDLFNRIEIVIMGVEAAWRVARRQEDILDEIRQWTEIAHDLTKLADDEVLFDFPLAVTRDLYWLAGISAQLAAMRLDEVAVAHQRAMDEEEADYQARYAEEEDRVYVRSIN
jgi:hypothetical protein